MIATAFIKFDYLANLSDVWCITHLSSKAFLVLMKKSQQKNLSISLFISPTWKQFFFLWNNKTRYSKWSKIQSKFNMLSFFSGITCFLFFFFFLLLINQLSANCFYQTYPFKNEMKIYFIFYIIKNKVCKAQLAYMQNLPGSVTCFASHNKFKMTTLRHGMFTTLQAYTLARLNTCKERVRHAIVTHLFWCQSLL